MSREQAIYSRGKTYYVQGVGILFDYGNTVPTDGVADYCPGAIFQKTNGVADACLYVNQGSLASCSFKPLDIGTILASNIPIIDPYEYFAGINVETVLSEIGNKMLPSGSLGKGPSPLIWDGCPLLDILMNPAKGWAWLEDFIGPNALLAGGSTDVHGWDVTQVVSGTFGQSESLIEGALSFAAGAITAGQGVNVQLKHLPIKLSSGATTRFEARVKSNAMSGADLSQIFVGLHETLTAIMASNVFEVGETDDSAIGFFQDSAGTVNKMDIVSAKGASSEVQADPVTVFDDTDYHTLGFVVTGTTYITFYADGVQVGDIMVDASDIPDGVTLFPSFVCQADGTVNATLDVDWIRISQERQRSAAGA